VGQHEAHDGLDSQTADLCPENPKYRPLDAVKIITVNSVPGRSETVCRGSEFSKPLKIKDITYIMYNNNLCNIMGGKYVHLPW